MHFRTEPDQSCTACLVYSNGTFSMIMTTANSSGRFWNRGPSEPRQEFVEESFVHDHRAMNLALKVFISKFVLDPARI